MKKDINKFATQFKAFCDPNRLQIINILLKGEQCACDIQNNVDIGQSTLSHHMKILIESEIVIPRKEGKWVHYSLSEKGIENVKNYLEELLDNKSILDDVCLCTNEEG